MKTPRNPPSLHAPLAAYSHQIEITYRERQLMMAGQVGMRPDGSVPDDAIEQLGVALDNVERNLEAAGMELADLVKLVVYLVGDWDNDARRALVAARLGAHRPCMRAIWVAALAGPTLRVELDAWASRAA
jgi:2-iminobutanoate/2-iminopropanoate deaminase